MLQAEAKNMATWKRHTVVISFALSLLLFVVAFFQMSMLAHAAGGGGGQAGGGGVEGDIAANESPFPMDDPEAIEAGQALFTGKLGCYACHGQDGGGGMGSALNDGQWTYGDEAADIYESIAQGRPNGMPPYLDAATDEEIWQLVALIMSLSAAE